MKIALALALLLAPPLAAQESAPRPAPAPKATTAEIAWFASWESGLAEAQRTNRPILLMSAAPQCHGVPGMW
jgi:hypothetical protein